MRRREFLDKMGQASLGFLGAPYLMSVDPLGMRRKRKGTRPPNIVLIFADDMGYGDLSIYGHPTLRTPHLDQMALEGVRLTQFYSAAPVCTPSRAALLTGRLPIRNGMCGEKRRVLFPDSVGGLPATELTLAESLKAAGYATGCVGKWHLGHLPEYLPTRHGFDEYFGIPYSNDMKPSPLMENEMVIEEPADQTTLTRRYTEKAVSFIERNQSHPFFLYFPHNFPHVPLHASKAFEGESLRGLYGDVVEELDWSVGEVLKTLKTLHLESNTLVLFTSDNGPWLPRGLAGGSAGLLKGGKGSTWEGGMREPFIGWWPGTIPSGVVSPELAATLDILPLCLNLAGVPLPQDRILDGMDILPALIGKGKSPRTSMFYYRDVRLTAARLGPWKAHFVTQEGYGDSPQEHTPPLLFHLEQDPSETTDVSEKHPEIVAEILSLVEAHKASVEPVVSQLDRTV